jgi:hypothetical protein
MERTARSEPATETWKAVAGFEGVYETSRLGRIRRITPPRTDREGSGEPVPCGCACHVPPNQQVGA